MKQVCLALVPVCALFSTAAAQESSSSTQRSTLTITANATVERVRITAPSSIVQMHVEVYAASGEKLFDQEIRGGNVFDWHLQDGQAQRLAPGAYVCVVTAKSVSGRLAQKLGTVTVAEKSASVQAGSLQLSLQQTQAIGPVEADSSWTIAGENEPQTPTVIANDGTDGQMIRGRGALTFRIGNFFSGLDTEQMRLTEAGDLGIGTSQPQAKLDVAGTIRAQRFLVVKPNLGNGDKTAAATQATDAVDGVQPLVAGTGTQNQIAKWTDNAGTLGDSGITETGGNVGIGTTNPGQLLQVNSAAGTNSAIAFSISGTVYGQWGIAGSNNSLIAGSVLGDSVFRNNGGQNILFSTNSGGSAQLYLRNGGNVGIGTTAPSARLHVNGGDIIVTTGANNGMQFGSPNGETGMSITTNTGRADLRYDGLKLSLVTGPPNAGPPSGTNGIAIDAAGKVGIGTPPSADARLRAVGGPNTGVHGDSINSNGVSGTSLEGPGVRGVSTNNVGVFGRSTNGLAGSFEGNVSVTGNVCAANVPCFSDARLKQYVTNLKYGVRHLLQLRPVSWQWKDPKQRQPTLGLVAQEVEPVMPELVLHGANAKDLLGLNYLGLIPVLVKGIQEQQEQIDALRKTNEALNARLQLIERALKNTRGSTRQRR